MKVVDVSIQAAEKRGEFETYVDVDSQYWERLETLLMRLGYSVERTDSQYHYTMRVAWKHMDQILAP